MIKIFVTCLGLDSTSLKFHPDAAGALKKMPNLPANHEADSPQKFICLPPIIEKTALNPPANHEADSPQKFIWLPPIIALD